MSRFREELFDLARIKIRLEFINSNSDDDGVRFKSVKKHFKQFSEISVESIIKKLSAFSSNLKIEISNKFYLNFLDISQEDSNPDLVIYITEQYYDTQDEIIKKFNQIVYSNNQHFRNYFTLIFLKTKSRSDKSLEIIADDIFYLNELENDQILSNSIKDILINRILNFSINSLKEIEIFQITQAHTLDENEKKIKIFDFLKMKSLKCLIFGDYKESTLLFQNIYDISIQNNDLPNIIKGLEGIIVSLYLIDRSYDKEKIQFNSEIEQNYLELNEKYKKYKYYEDSVYSLIRLCIYYTHFEINKTQFMKVVEKIQEDNKNISFRFRTKISLKLHIIFNQFQMRKKGFFYLLDALNYSIENEDKESEIILDEIATLQGLIQPGIDNEYHKRMKFRKEVSRKKWKNLIFKEIPYFDVNAEIEFFKGMPALNNKLKVSDRNKKLINEFQSFGWCQLQLLTIKNAFKIYQKIQKLEEIPSKVILMILMFLQNQSEFLMPSDQFNFFNSIKNIQHKNDINNKLYGNMYKFPYLLNVKVLDNDCKFSKKDYNKIFGNLNLKAISSEDSNENGLIYNHWMKVKDNQLFWTVNSIQTLEISVYNPYYFEISLININLITEGSRCFSFPNSTIIQPKCYQVIKSKIKLLEAGIINIKGIRYQTSGIWAIQYFDPKGNGLFFNLTLRSKELKTLNEITVFPEIITIKPKIVCHQIQENNVVEVYDFEEISFEFIVENISHFRIKSIIFSVYIYTEKGIKQLLDESRYNSTEKLILEKNDLFRFTFKYSHKNRRKKIEFKLHYHLFDNDQNGFQEIYFNPNYNIELNFLNKSFIEFEKNLDVFPLTTNNYIENLIDCDERLNKEFSKEFINDYYLVRFNIINHHEKSSLEIIHKMKDKLINKQILSENSSQEIAFILNSDSNDKDFSLEWKLIENSKTGIITLNDITKLYSINLDQNFNLKIEKQVVFSEEWDQNALNVSYIVTNKSKNIFNNLIIRVYFFEIMNQKLFFNENLKSQLLYEGSLDYKVSKMNIEEIFTYKLSVLIESQTNYFTCFLIEDKDNKRIYICPQSLQL